MENVWSFTFARRVADILGYRVGESVAAQGPGHVLSGPETEAILAELTEAFRYLPAEQIQSVIDFAEFLRAQRAQGTPVPHLESWVAEKFREARDLALFLKTRYGRDLPADEQDFWSEEDEQLLTRHTFERLEEGRQVQEEQGNAEAR
jgi:hypothetical protein